MKNAPRAILDDPLSPSQRRYCMSQIRAKNTKPEILVRKGLHRKGFRYRLHDKQLPGCPDIVLARYRAVIFVHGCFWHGHECHLFKLPATRSDFWQQKITRNKLVDARAQKALQLLGWRVLTVWECSLRGRTRRNYDEVIGSIGAWLASEAPETSIDGMTEGIAW